MEYVLCREASNLGIEPMPCFAYGLCNLELTFLVVPNVANSDSSAEIPKHTVVGFANNGLERFYLFAQLIVGSSSSVELRRQCVELTSDVLQFLQDASSTKLG